MPRKGEQTRTALLEIAKTLFSEKGYSAVTMQDFCERSELSRGGLYRHFASTREIFLAMLEQDRKNSAQELEQAIARQVPARQLLRTFIDQQRQIVVEDRGRLAIAIYEFCAVDPGPKEYLSQRLNSAVETLTALVRYGQARGEFGNRAAQETARHVIIFLEGLKLSAGVIPFSEAMLDEQLNLIEQMLAQ